MKRIGILLLTCVLVLSLTACGAKQEETEDAVVVEVGGVSFRKSEAEEIYQATLKQTLNMYEQMGFPMDETDEEFIAMMKTEALNGIGEQLALEQELEKLGIGLTDADIKTIDEQAQNEYDTTIEQFAAYNQISREDAVQAAVDAAYTVSVLQFGLRGEEVQNRLQNHFSSGVTVTDDEILERYDALLEDQKETYAADASQYITDVFNESIIVSRPAGLRHVKNIVIALPDDIMAQIEDIDSQMYEITYYMYMIETELGAGEMEDSRKEELETAQAVYQEEFDRLNQEVATLMKTGQDQVRAEAEAVLALAKAEGADFDAVLADHSADKPTGDLLTKGYPVGANVTNYVTSFTEASMALEKIGDVSELVESVYGFHILQYAEDVVSGVVPLEEVKTEIHELLLGAKQEEVLSGEIARITEAADIKVYVDRL